MNFTLRFTSAAGDPAPAAFARVPVFRQMNALAAMMVGDWVVAALVVIALVTLAAVVLAAVFVGIAALSGFLIAVIRGIRNFVHNIFKTTLELFDHWILGFRHLIWRAVDGMLDHHPDKTKINAWRGWSLILPGFFGAVSATLIGADYSLASRIGVLLGLAESGEVPGIIRNLLGLIFVTTGVLLGLAYLDCHGITPAGHPVLTSRVSNTARPRVERILRWLVLAVIADAMILMAWTAEYVLTKHSDGPLVGIFLVAFSGLAFIATLIAMIGGMIALALPFILFFFVLLLLFYVAAVLLFLVGSILMPIFTLLEWLVIHLAIIGCTIWNHLPFGKNHNLKPPSPPEDPKVGELTLALPRFHEETEPPKWTAAPAPAQSKELAAPEKSELAGTGAH